jgi:hypothetical protein
LIDQEERQRRQEELNKAKDALKERRNCGQGPPAPDTEKRAKALKKRAKKLNSKVMRAMLRKRPSRRREVPISTASLQELERDPDVHDRHWGDASTNTSTWILKNRNNIFKFLFFKCFLCNVND